MAGIGNTFLSLAISRKLPNPAAEVTRRIIKADPRFSHALFTSGVTPLTGLKPNAKRPLIECNHCLRPGKVASIRSCSSRREIASRLLSKFSKRRLASK